MSSDVVWKFSACKSYIVFCKIVSHSTWLMFWEKCVFSIVIFCCNHMKLFI